MWVQVVFSWELMQDLCSANLRTASRRRRGFGQSCLGVGECISERHPETILFCNNVAMAVRKVPSWPARVIRMRHRGADACRKRILPVELLLRRTALGRRPRSAAKKEKGRTTGPAFSHTLHPRTRVQQQQDELTPCCVPNQSPVLVTPRTKTSNLWMGPLEAINRDQRRTKRRRDTEVWAAFADNFGMKRAVLVVLLALAVFCICFFVIFS